MLSQKKLKTLQIQGTETDKNGNIIKCPNYQKEHNKRFENRAEYIKSINKQTEESTHTINFKLRILEEHALRVQNETEDERELKRKQANEYIQNILLNRKIEQEYKKGFFPLKVKNQLLAIQNIEQKQARLNEIKTNPINSQIIEKDNNITKTEYKKKVTKSCIKSNALLSTQQKRLLLNITNCEERDKKYFELIDLKNRQNKLESDLFAFRQKSFNFAKMTDQELIEYIKQLNKIYTVNQFSEYLTDCEVKAILDDFKRIISNDLLRFYLNDILSKLNKNSRTNSEKFYILKIQKEMEYKKRLSESAKRRWEKRKQKQVINS